MLVFAACGTVPIQTVSMHRSLQRTLHLTASEFQIFVVMLMNNKLQQETRLEPGQ